MSHALVEKCDEAMVPSSVLGLMRDLVRASCFNLANAVSEPSPEFRCDSEPSSLLVSLEHGPNGTCLVIAENMLKVFS